MVSIGPYCEKTNMTHMFNMNDLRGPLPQKIENPGSLSYIISNTREFSKFRYILRLSKLDGIYNDLEANFTLFVPTDLSLSNIPDTFLTNMDLLTARQIVRASTLNRRITSDILSDSPCAYFNTRDEKSRLFITNMNGQTSINNNINVINSDIQAFNGIIHVTDGLIWPIM